MPASNRQKPGCLTVLFPFLKPARQVQVIEALPYRLRDDFLSPAEFSFYKVLCSVVGAEFSVQAKVRLADVFFVSGIRQQYYHYFNRISARHLDFLVCQAITMKPVFGIELDDASHAESKRQERDQFVDQVFKEAGFPLLHFPVQRAYVSDELTARIAPILRLAPASTPFALAQAQSQRDSIPICPKCGIPMVLRTAAQGEHKGEQFYGCRNFPRCREVERIMVQAASQN